jgi:hypothetical protein
MILLFFVLFVINQTAQIVQLADKISPLFGTVIFWFLVLVYTVLFVTTVLIFLRLPSPLIPPRNENTPEFDAYLNALKKRLVRNSLLKGIDLSTRENIESALSILGNKSEEIVKETATTVFVSTAISQSGRLDAFLVLATQSQMVWKIARVHYQRPTLSDLIHLYANVAGTVFLAGELDDIDISDQVEPVLSSTIGVLTGIIPGIQLAASILVNSILSGTANAFLTLRVGIIAKRYCGSVVLEEKRSLRRAAGAEAALMLGSIVKQGTAKLSKAILKASKGKLSGLFSSAKGYAKDTGNSMLSKIGLNKTKESLFVEIVESASKPNNSLDPERPDPAHKRSKK